MQNIIYFFGLIFGGGGGGKCGLGMFLTGLMIYPHMKRD